MSQHIPNKQLGQHWLHDNATLSHICDLAELKMTDTVLEVGPGLGTLTRKLVKRAEHVVAVELDKSLADSLSTRVEALNLNVEHKSVLEYDLNNLPTDYKVVANIPYYLTAKLLRMLLESDNPPILTVLLIQKEVAQRVAAAPGQMSILAVSAQYYAEVELGREVPAKLFTPPPKVDSQVVKLSRRQEPLFSDIKTEDYFKVVKAGFSEKRKKLRSSLSGGLNLPKDQIDQLLKSAEISADARAQELTLDNWAKLVRLLY